MKYDVIVVGGGSAGSVVASPAVGRPQSLGAAFGGGARLRRSGAAPGAGPQRPLVGGRNHRLGGFLEPARRHQRPAGRDKHRPGQGHRRLRPPSTARSTCAACPRTSSVGSPTSATRNGAILKSYPTTAGLKPTWTSRTTSTAPKAQSPSSAARARSGLRYRRRSTTPVWSGAAHRTTTSTEPTPAASAPSP